jgi:hypothetical protein
MQQEKGVNQIVSVRHGKYHESINESINYVEMTSPLMIMSKMKRKGNLVLCHHHQRSHHRRRRYRFRTFTPSSVRGGKNSMETNGLLPTSFFLIRSMIFALASLSVLMIGIG